MAGFTAERTGISEALARQLEMQAQQQRWLEEQVGRDIGRIETERPELLGRLASGYAARGAYHSGARREAEGDLTQQLAQQIEDMRTGLVQGQQQAVWRRTQLNVEALQAMEDLARQEEAAQLQWTLQGQARGEAFRGGGGGGGRAGRGRGRGRGGGGGGGGMIDPDRNRTEAQAWRDARVTILRSQGLSLADAWSRAITEMRVRYPHLDETWLYAGGVFQQFGSPPTSMATNKVWSDAHRQARNFLSNNPRASTQDFVDWYKTQFSPAERSRVNEYIEVINRAFTDASIKLRDPRSTFGGLGGWR